MYQVDLLEDPKRMNQKHVFEQEFLPLMEALYNYAVHLTRNKVEAEDLVQETSKKRLAQWTNTSKEPMRRLGCSVSSTIPLSTNFGMEGVARGWSNWKKP